MNRVLSNLCAPHLPGSMLAVLLLRMQHHTFPSSPPLSCSSPSPLPPRTLWSMPWRLRHPAQLVGRSHACKEGMVKAVKKKDYFAGIESTTYMNKGKREGDSCLGMQRNVRHTLLHELSFPSCLTWQAALHTHTHTHFYTCASTHTCARTPSPTTPLRLPRLAGPVPAQGDSAPCLQVISKSGILNHCGS